MMKQEITSFIQEKCVVLFEGIDQLIENARSKVAVILNVESSLLYWSVGYYINSELKTEDRLKYGAKILATLSQQLSWSHLIELASIDNNGKTIIIEYESGEPKERIK